MEKQITEKPRIDILTLYQILAAPLPLKNKDIRQIKSCSETTATRYMKEVQNFYAAKGFKVNPKYITRQQLLAYEGWDWDEIKKEALDLIAAKQLA